MAIPSFNMYISIILPIKAVYSELGLLFYWTTTQWYQVWIGLLHMAPNICKPLSYLSTLRGKVTAQHRFCASISSWITIQSLRVALWIMTTKKCDIVVTTQLGLDYKALRDEVVQKVRQIVFIDLYMHCVYVKSGYMHVLTCMLTSEIFLKYFLHLFC